MDAKTPVIEVLPDESLDSVIARIYKLCGYSSWHHILHDIVGRWGRLPSNRIPAQLDGIANFIGGQWSGMGVLQKLTLWNGLSMFMRAEERTRLQVRLLESAMADDVRLDLGAAKPRLRQPFRLCRSCMEEDEDAYGVAYWHRSHQMPLVSTCWRHAKVLHGVKTSRGKCIVLLPSEADDLQLVTSEPASAEARRYALTTHDVLNCVTPPSVDLLPDVYRTKMHRLELAVGSRIHYRALADLCASVQSGLFLPDRLGAPDHWLSLVLYGHSVNSGLHFMLITALFGNWSEFLEACRSPGPLVQAPPPKRVRRPSPSCRELQAAFGEAGATIGTVAKSTGWSGNTIRNRARYCGIDVPSRSGTIGIRAKEAITKELAKGIPALRISRNRHVSLSTIYALSRSCRAVKESRAEVVADVARCGRRKKLQHYLSASPSLRRSDVRTMDNCLYGWLLRNDREWFEKTVHCTSRPAKRGDT